jgi:ribosomal protein L11
VVIKHIKEITSSIYGNVSNGSRKSNENKKENYMGRISIKHIKEIASSIYGNISYVSYGSRN